MRHFYLVITLSIIVFGSCTGGKAVLQGDPKDRYSIEVPDKWKKNGKLLNAISEILPEAVNELRDKKFCLDCQASYIVKFEMSDFERAAQEGAVAVFRFKAAFKVFNSANKAIVSFIVMDPVKDEAIFYDSGADPTIGIIANYKIVENSATNDPRLYKLAYPVTDLQTTGLSQFGEKTQQINYKNFLRCTEKKIYEIQSMLNAQ